MQQAACLVVNSITVGIFAFLFYCTPAGQTSDSTIVPTWRLIYRWGGWGLMLWLLSCHRGLTVGFLLLRYSVVCTFEYLSLLYLLFISWFICFRRQFMGKLGIFHANQTSLCLAPHLNLGWGWDHETTSSRPKKITDHSKAVLLLWIIF